MFRSPHSLFFSGLILALVVFPAPSDAAPVAFEFTATVDTFMDNGSLPGVMQGTMISGRYVFDGDAAQIPDAPGIGTYHFAMIFNARVELPSGTVVALTPAASPGPNTEIRVIDKAIATMEDESYRAVMQNLIADGSTGDLDDFAVTLSSPTDTTAIVGTDLPQVPPDLSAFPTAQVAIFFPDQSTLSADLMTLPEAGSGAAALALFLVAARARRRR